MKRIISALMTVIMLCTLAQGKNRTATENDSLGNPERVIELKDTMINGKSVTGTLNIMTYGNSAHRHTGSDNGYESHNDAYGSSWDIRYSTREAIIAIVVIVSIFGSPLAVVFIVFFFRYRSRKAKYRLVEQALANGQLLPEHLFKDTESINTRSKGTKSVFAGIGLFIFPQTIIDKSRLDHIGLLIVFTGLGQVVIYCTQQHKVPRGNRQPDNTKTGFPGRNEEK